MASCAADRLVLAALLIAGIWYFWRRSRPVTNPLTTLAQAAIEDIQAGGDVQSVVVRCYLEMSQVLGQQRGIARGARNDPARVCPVLGGLGRTRQAYPAAHANIRARALQRPASQRGDERAAVECLTAIVHAYGGAS